MKGEKKSLQKFTELPSKVNELLKLELIQNSDIERLNKDEQNALFRYLNEEIMRVKGSERDQFVKKIYPFLSEETRNQLWETNHNRITVAISKIIQDTGRMPSKGELAEETGLSRQTIYKHIKEYVAHPLYMEHIEQFKFMTSKVLAKVFKFAVMGDIRAAKLYFELIGNINGQPFGSTTIKNQNNYIQINNTILTEDLVKKLTPGQLKKIEEIIQRGRV